MKTRRIGHREIPEIGLGCMNLSHAYGHPPSEQEAIALLHAAYDMGVRHFDTAALYGFGKNESLVGKAFAGRWRDIHLASKCGIFQENGVRKIDGRPETLEKTLNDALQRLGVDHIDLYYLHRWDKSIPIEESMGMLSRLVEQGKISQIGLSEVSAATLRKAHAVHPITAVQSEYSLWSRNPEIAILDACQELNITFVAFSPLARGYLTNGVKSRDELVETDIRLGMPRFTEQNLQANRPLVELINLLAAELNVSPAQVCIAWVLAQRENIIALPGTRSIEHLEDNLTASSLYLPDECLSRLNKTFSIENIHGDRYPPQTQAEIDTEEF